MEIVKNNNLDIENNLSKEINQEKFINTALGKTINSGIDIVLRTLLPDFIEDKIIELKNNLLEYGLKDGINKTVKDTIQEGKRAIGIVTGNFEDVSQIQSAIKSGGTVDQISYVLDFAIRQVKNAGLINNKVESVLKNGKDSILHNIESSLENTLKEQTEDITNLEEYIKDWKESFENKDFDNMQKYYNKIESNMKKLIPFEKTINDARIVENLHNLIKNNGKNFNLNRETIELSKKLI